MASYARWLSITCSVVLLLSCLLYITLSRTQMHADIDPLMNIVPAFLVPPSIINVADPKELVHTKTELLVSETRTSSSGGNVTDLESSLASIRSLGGISAQPGHNQTMTKVLLMTYYRGGSSFFGQLFAQNHDVFYWFEPLDSQALTMRSDFGHLDGIKLVETDFRLLPNGSIGPLPDQMMAVRTLTMVRTLSCNATFLDRITLSGQFFRTGQGMPRFGPYLKCLRGIKRMKRYESCSPVLQETCLNSTIVAAKVIRYPMYEVPKLLQHIPDLKVIHYVRDPRGIISSRAKIHGWSGSKITTNSRYLCTKMSKNHKVFTELQQQNPANYLLLRYEDLSLDPQNTARKIYKFLGHPYPDYINTWIKRNTEAISSDWTYGTRRNAKSTVYKWRTQFIGKDYRSSTEQCRIILNVLGYKL